MNEMPGRTARSAKVWSSVDIVHWTSSCRRVVAVKTESFTVGAPHTISMDFYVSFQVVLRIKLLPTFITIVHLQIGHFFSDIFQR